MNKYKKLIKNSAIFTIGNLGSKIISIILVPLYTYNLSTLEYGTVDIVTTTTNMLLPIVTLSIYEATLRYAMDNTESKVSVFTNTLMITIFGSTISLLFYPLFNSIEAVNEVLIYTYAILILQAFQNLLSQFARAIGNVKIFAVNGIIQTLFLGISNIFFLVILKEGVKGYLLSIILSNIVSVLYLSLSINFSEYIDFSTLNKKLSKKMLRYAIPLIPNALMWWLINASNRYFILYYEGAQVNGLYAVANKIPTLLTLFTTIFSQAWQLSAIEEYDSEDNSKFYSNIFSYYQMFLMLGTSMLLVILKNIMKIAVAEEYYIAWEYVPFLLLGVIFSSFSGFLGTNYTVAKETKGVFKTSVLGSLLCVILNFMLVPSIGAIGASLSTAVGFLVMWLLRLKDTKRYIDIDIDIRNLVYSVGIILLQITVLFVDWKNIIEKIILISLFSILVALNRKILLPLLTFKNR